MPGIQLTVPLVKQARDWSCWNGAATMIWYYWQQKTGRQGPMNTLQDRFALADTQGLPLSMIWKLGEKVGLKSLPWQSTYSQADLYSFLRKHGPIWAAGTFGGGGHVIVLTGVDSARVYFNDPWEPMRKIHSIAWFNSHVLLHPNSLMVKDPLRY